MDAFLVTGPGAEIEISFLGSPNQSGTVRNNPNLKWGLGFGVWDLGANA